MTFNPEIHHRRSIRLKDYDYSQAGAYFVTICTWQFECLFGDIVEGGMRLNELGRVVLAEWNRTTEIRKEIELDVAVVMPNHFHGIICIVDDRTTVGATGRSPLPPGPRPRSLGAFVGGFKAATTKQINIIRDNPGCPVWQRNYYERVIRNETELERAREYIINNPQKWALDKDNPQLIGCRGDRPVAPTQRLPATGAHYPQQLPGRVDGLPHQLPEDLGAETGKP
jgi:REP element-mobilizing transposase RayT